MNPCFKHTRVWLLFPREDVQRCFWASWLKGVSVKQLCSLALLNNRTPSVSSLVKGKDNTLNDRKGNDLRLTVKNNRQGIETSETTLKLLSLLKENPLTKWEISQWETMEAKNTRACSYRATLFWFCFVFPFLYSNQTFLNISRSANHRYTAA